MSRSNNFIKTNNSPTKKARGKNILENMIEEKHRENVGGVFNRIGKQRVKFAHSEIHWSFFLVILD
jgi:hypothetical protein